MADAEKTVTFALTDYRVSSFDPDIRGVDPITQSGTEVAAKHEKSVVEAAEKAGVSLKKM